MCVDVCVGVWHLEGPMTFLTTIMVEVELELSSFVCVHQNARMIAVTPPPITLNRTQPFLNDKHCAVCLVDILNLKLA